ncbi:nitric oxide reductase transcriptional regulator NorR [Pseudomonas massiliensis]|uniref:nitric oxide reductase transcriptional regulator NorR n=1 Tax=Pseudomonas massiliensis TaxID=522492 RepID=UPI00058B303B|nr:nitric oxide reductase transcriptional regulator NorR [Pseudomonas massiliensis]
MTSKPLLQALLGLISDLSLALPESERYRRLLNAMRRLLPCDAAALLRLDGEWLIPVAVDGLSEDTLGRRFRISEHPRFQALLSRTSPTRFPADSPLPDPYDGLISGRHDHLEVHDCLGCPLLINQQPWGLLTLDALDPARFDPIEPGTLEAFASLAAAIVTVEQHIARLADTVQLERERADGLLQASAPNQELIGRSPSMLALLDQVKLVGPSELTVLITGETGVGKELVAQALHKASSRAKKAMISLNCAALPDALVESELFGHVKGAFTGAVTDRRGKFELADGGTLFLDEVGELPLSVQAKLLRVLQTGQLQRLGSDREHRVNVRLIAATNRDLAAEVTAGRCRADFYHRLSVYPLRVPALRERNKDVLLLAGYFLEQNRSRLGVGGIRLDTDAQAALLAYAWPGNVRELEHLIGRSALTALGRLSSRPRILTLTRADLGLEPGLQQAAVMRLDAVTTERAETERTEVPAGDLRQAVDSLQRRMIEDCLRRHDNHWTAAARELGLDRANLSRLARRLGLR